MSRRTLRRRKSLLAWNLLVGMAAVVCARELVCAREAAAQPPKITSKEYRAKITAANNDIRRIVESPAALSSTDRDKLDAYFTEALKLFVFPEKPDDLPFVRHRGYKIVVRAAGKTPAHDYLNQRVYKEMTRILLGQRDKLIAPQYQAAVKYNALLLIADLNESEGMSGTRPMPEALPFLMGVAFTDKLPDYLKPAALIGLTRFAQEGAIPKDRSADVTKHLLTLLNQQTAPAGRTPSAHHYLRRQAGKMLAALGELGPNNEVLSAFEAIAADPSASPMLRCEMVRFIAELKFPEKSNVDFGRLTNAIGHQTVDICKQEAERSRNRAGRPASRRLFMYALDGSKAALAAISSAAGRDAPARSTLDELRDKIDALYKSISDVDATREEQVAGIVEKEIANIEGLLGERPEPKAALAAAEKKAEPAKPTSTN